ncbi:lactosylceramide 1,3-N-acetyl-beta-D-glucosaminyltransferase-like isoform X1 [Cydia fagiglandana]|uniref:lactosylceramide 1,3-N-acetyl-beta-D-glucosaminyltransferase-like isoform X1 n=1 Tax=Cydia fagiglandana TaxID=1458189 RepID=UPI002FEE45B7
MAHAHDEDYEDRYYSSGRDSDDSPILYNRYATRVARSPSPEPRTRRSTVTTLAKFFLFCTAMIMFCVLLYIPVYNKANDQMFKGAAVAGWSMNTNRDTKIYVQPNNVTTIHEPKHICPPYNIDKKNNLFLLIIVCSSTTHFDRRVAIRETWGHYKTYLQLSKIYNEIREKYKDYNYTYDLYPVDSHINSSQKTKRDISSFKNLLPELAKALKNNLNDKVEVKTEVPEEKRFEDDVMLPEFDMNKELGDDNDYKYDYESNVMKIPPKGYEDNTNLDKVLNMLWEDKTILKEDDVKVKEDFKIEGEPDFKLLFLLGLPSNENDTEVQNKIEEEVEKYGDVLQEGFIDSYNNLTLKSIMMLKWVTNKCNESVRYILKTDDDMYINVPALVTNLRNRSKDHDLKHPNSKEYLLIGDLICGARPVADKHNKWYSPRYMYSGRVYPRYLSGTGYALSAPTASALYRAALHQTYFHLEDIYITGMCALRATPVIQPRDDAMFSYQLLGGGARAACAAHARVTAHHVPPRALHDILRRLLQPGKVDQCERLRLTQVRRDRMRPKTRPKGKRLTKIPPRL